jgi:hypothetical protein
MGPVKNRSLTVLQPNMDAVPSPLRFYDPELQNAWNAEPFDKVRLQRASQNAKELNLAYLRQMKDLVDRVSKRTFALFSDPEQPLFDADLFELSIGDALKYAVPKRRRVAPSTSVRATFRSFDSKTLHVLTYNRIASVNFNLPHDRWFSWPSGGSRIDSLLAHELTSMDATLMKHAFLFVSGATISIHFERVKWETRRNELR